MTEFWLAVIAVSLGSFALRFSFLAVNDPQKAKSAGILNKFLPYIPPAVLAALIVPSVLESFQPLRLETYGPLAALLAAVGLGLRFKRPLLTIAGGMVVLWLWRKLWL